MEPVIFDKQVSFEEDHTDPAGPKLTIRHLQEFPEGYIDDLLREKIDTEHAPIGEFFRFASIPIGVLEQWDREGFKIEEHTAAQICARLNKEGLDAFITTTKRL